MVKVRRAVTNKPIMFENKKSNPNYTYVGFWSTWQDESKFIRPQFLVDENWERENRQKIIDYLKSGSSCAQYLGWSWCRICKEENGYTDFTDGKWIWPEGLAHYIEEHNVRLPDKFVNHMRSKGFTIDSFDEVGVYNGGYTFWNNWCKKQKERLCVEL